MRQPIGVPMEDMLAIQDSSVEPSWMGMVLFDSCSCGKAMAEKPKVMPVLMVPSWATSEANTCLTALPRRGRGSSGSSCAPLPFAIFSSFGSVDGWNFGSSVESTSDVFSGSCTPQFFLDQESSVCALVINVVLVLVVVVVVVLILVAALCVILYPVMFEDLRMPHDDDQPPSSRCDIASLFPRDKNDNAIPSDSGDVSDDHNGNYYADCDSSVWMRSCEQEVIEPLAGKLAGNIPEWLKGTLLRNGPGNLKVGEYTFQHLFDSSALVHRFGIADGKVTYQRRFVQTEVYKKNMAAQRIVVTEFGTRATPDPCQSIFHRIAAVFNPGENLSDNTMISVYPFGDEYYTFTEAPVMHRIDPKTLETTSRVDVSKYVNIVNHTSHPHVMADGTVYNVGLSVTPLGPRYNVVCFYPSRVIVDESGEEKELSMFDQATIVASMPCRWMLNPSYMHTFGITENYFIIVEQPLAISMVSMMVTHLKQEPMFNSFKWHEDENTLIHVMSRETGQTVRTFVAETFFFLHIINQFETRDREYVVLDICCYRDPKMLECMYIDSMKNMHENPDYASMFRGRPLRFVLPMKQPCANTPPECNLVTIKTVHQSQELFRNVDDKSLGHDSDKMDFEIVSDSDVVVSNVDDVKRKWDEHRNALRRKPAAHLLPDGRIFVKPELLCDLGCETPRINADFCVGREYRYFYAISSDVDLVNPAKLIKVDTYRKTRKVWQEKDVFPSEPIFVANPYAKDEDDGVIVSSLVWGQNESRVGLLILDAATFTEIARATFDSPGPAPKCLHGWFTLDK